MNDTVYCGSCNRTYTAYYFDKHILSKKHLNIKRVQKKIFFKIEKKKCLVKF